MGFYQKDGALYCENIRVKDLLRKDIATPFYLYSLEKLRQNIKEYLLAVEGLPSIVGYAIKANHNRKLCQEIASQGAGAVVVSKDELLHALQAGFSKEKIWLHGNGKRPEDIKEALQANILLSVDSEFDLENISRMAKEQSCVASLLLRVNPNIDPKVHPYISTGLKESKFGIAADKLETFAEKASRLSCVKIRGLHCHLGSTLTEVRPFADAAKLMVELAKKLQQKNLPCDILNLGGGLGIDYTRTQTLPSPKQLVDTIRNEIQNTNLTLLLEPGRSLVGNTGALIGRVVGVKQTENKNFLVVDASMAQLLRPCLYDAYHHTSLIQEEKTEEKVYDVVGPLCESGDFLAKDRTLQTPKTGDGIAILDAGAYGFSMASRYNLHLFCAEYVVDGSFVWQTRRAESYQDFSRFFCEEKVSLPNHETS